jgi:hypothetical protein
MAKEVTATTKDIYWYAKGKKFYTGKIEPGLKVSSGVPEFVFGTKEEVAQALDKYQELLPENTEYGFYKTANGIEFKEVSALEAK